MRTGSIFAVTKDGLIKGKGLNRMTEEERWSTEGFKEPKGIP